MPKKIDVAANEVAKSVVMAVAKDVIEHTPVDETTAASNWQGDIARPASFELPAIFPGSHGSTAAQSRAAAIAHVERTTADKDPGIPFYLSNLMDYIRKLNNGSSRQEPKGFVERATLVGRLTVRKSKLRLK